MTMLEWTLIAVLVIIFLFTVISQFQNKLVDNIRQKDLLNFLPAWYFFAPRPVTYNLYLLYRDEYIGGEISSWKQIEFSVIRKWWHFLWNPKKRLNKSFFDIFKDLMDHLKIDSSQEFIAISIPYLLLLNFISHQEHSALANRTQFAVLRKEAGENTYEMLFVSFFHALETSQLSSFAEYA